MQTSTVQDEEAKRYFCSGGYDEINGGVCGSTGDGAKKVVSE